MSLLLVLYDGYEGVSIIVYTGPIRLAFDEGLSGSCVHSLLYPPLPSLKRLKRDKAKSAGALQSVCGPMARINRARSNFSQ